MSFKKLATRLLSIAAITGSFIAASPAQATLTISHPVGADSHHLTLNDNGVESALFTFCVTPFVPGVYAGETKDYTFVRDGESYFGAAKTALIGQLFTAFDLYNGETGVDDLEEMALENALWALVDDTQSDEWWLGAAGEDNHPALQLARGFIAEMNPNNNWYEVGVYTNNDANTVSVRQDYLWLNKVTDANAVPEPGSLALVALALGGVGGIARRRKALAMKAAV